MKDELFEASLPTYYLSKLAGLTPLKRVKERTQAGIKFKYVNSIFGRIYSVLIMIVIAIGATIMITWRIKNTYPKLNKMTVLMTDFCLLLATSIIAITSIAKFSMEKFKAIDYLSAISEIDEYLLPTTDRIWKNMRIIQFLEIIYIAFYFIILFSFQKTVWVLEHGSKNTYHFPISFVIHFVIVVAEIQHFNLILLLKHRFSVLNSYIKEAKEFYSISGKTQNTWVVMSARPRKTKLMKNFRCYSRHDWLRRLKQLRSINDSLCDIASNMNSTYGFPILLSVTVTFVSITTCLYFGICFIEKMKSNLDAKPLIFSLLWASVGFFRLSSINLSCNAASHEANTSAILLQKILLQPDLQHEEVTEVSLFLQQVRNRVVKFTAWDFFTMNSSTLCSTIGCITTYLVILMQFRNEDITNMTIKET